MGSGIRESGDEKMKKIIEIMRKANKKAEIFSFEPSEEIRIIELPSEECKSLFNWKREILGLIIIAGTLFIFFILMLQIPRSFFSVVFFILLLPTIFKSIMFVIFYIPSNIDLKRIMDQIQKRPNRLFDPISSYLYPVRIFNMDQKPKHKGEIGLMVLDWDNKAILFEGETIRFSLPAKAVRELTLYSEWKTQSRGSIQFILKVNTPQGDWNIGFSVIYIWEEIFIKLLLRYDIKKLLSKGYEEKDKEEAESSVVFPGEVIDLPQGESGKILNFKTLVLMHILSPWNFYSLLLIISAGFFSVAIFVILIILLSKDLSKNPSYFISSPLMYYLWGTFFLILCLFLLARFLWRFTRKQGFDLWYLNHLTSHVIRRRSPQDIFVHPEDPEKIFVEIVPDYNLIRPILEPAIDLGFMKLDKEKNEFLYEGDRLRLRVPLESNFFSNLEKWAQATPSGSFIIMKIKTHYGIREFSFRRRRAKMP